MGKYNIKKTINNYNKIVEEDETFYFNNEENPIINFDIIKQGIFYFFINSPLMQKNLDEFIKNRTSTEKN